MADLPADPSAPTGPRIAGPGSPEWPEALRHFAEAPVSPRRTEMHRMGDALRRIIERLHGSPAPDAELRSAADDLERLADRLDAFPNSSVYEGFSEATVAGADPHAFFDHSPMLGRANPLAPPIELWADGDTMRGRVSFGSTYEGPPGCVHGGYVAAAFDEVLGSTQSLAGRPGMTGRLTVHYRSPTPLHADLRFAARVVEVSGRKTMTHGTLHAGDRLCAEAEGLFIAIDFTKMVELRRRREEALGSAPDQGG